MFSKTNGQHRKQFGRNGHFSYDRPTKITKTYFTGRGFLLLQET